MLASIVTLVFLVSYALWSLLPKEQVKAKQTSLVVSGCAAVVWAVLVAVGLANV